MSVATFPCPQCKVVLKPTKPVPPGKKIKCPKCGHIFQTSATEAPAPASSAAPQPAKLPSAPFRMEEPDEAGWELIEDDEPEPPPIKKPPKATKAVVREEEEPDDDRDQDDRPSRRRQTTVKKRRRGEEDEDEDEEDEDYEDDDYEDDRPRRTKRKRKSAYGSLLKLYLIIFGVCFLLLVGSAAGGLYWYLNAGRNRGTGNEDPLAYVLPDSSLVMGLDVPALMKEPQLARRIEEQLNRQAGPDFFTNVKKETGLEMADLCERTLFVSWREPANLPIPRQIWTTILYSKTPFSQRKICKCLQDPKSEKIKGKTVYRTSQTTVFMPSDRILILTGLPDSQLEIMVGSDGSTLALTPELQSMVRNVEKHQGWLIAPMDARSKQDLEKGKEREPAEQRLVQQHLIKSHGAAAGLDISGGQGTFELELDYPDAASAKQAVTDLEQLWNRSLKGLDIQMILNVLPKEAAAFLKEIINSTKFSNDGVRARAVTQFSMQGLNSFLQNSQGQPFGPMGPFMRPGPGAGGMPQAR
jgi:hypothetical protein